MNAVCPVCDQSHTCAEDRREEPCEACAAIGWRSRPDGVYFRVPHGTESAVPPFESQEA